MRCEEAHRGTRNTSTAARRHQGFGSAHTSLGEKGIDTPHLPLHLRQYHLRVVLPQAADALPYGRPSLASAANHLHIMPLPEYSLWGGGNSYAVVSAKDYVIPLESYAL